MPATAYTYVPPRDTRLPVPGAAPHAAWQMVNPRRGGCAKSGCAGFREIPESPICSGCGHHNREHDSF
ncbi:hypothetical protein SAMN05444413_1167 [Roseivivax marinus]|jgi:hypothetical protein|nr:hypothetical protein SAMN05444413_1167 [Roseivivax marinus]